MLLGEAPAADGADPQMLGVQRNQRDPEQLEPHARLDADGRHCYLDSQPAVRLLSDGSGG